MIEMLQSRVYVNERNWVHKLLCSCYPLQTFSAPHVAFFHLILR